MAIAAAPLDALGAFARRQGTVSWFAACGTPLVAGERGDAFVYAAALGFPEAAIAPVADWRAAEAIARGDGFTAWRTVEERERAALLAAGNARHGFAALMAALTRVTAAASATTMGAASAAMAREGVADPALARAAAGAAAQAAYQAALALAAESGDHAFAIKFRLFAAGRWPLGIADGRLYLF